ncbi:MAG: hypothetical protein HMLKMBBP_02802 [Planctomycetes bacterium]|nr:hypothetical protein [Planctomycetota bacterium]
MPRRDRRRHTDAVHVDGQNAIHSIALDEAMPRAGIDALRRRLVEIVAAACHGGHGRVTVHFDGHPPSGAFGKTRVDDVFVMFSGDREADEDMADAVRHAARPQTILVVTDDLELARRVTAMGARSARVSAFLAPRGPRHAEVPSEPEAGSLAGGFTPADFGLPDRIDLDAPPPAASPVDSGIRSMPRKNPSN